ncbi:YXWGXW repeat-containing protein [Massilia agilis]|uniref:YXWGXW repeat-containing protein n=1 Tax=Massilia agilis TaxID=1811226 RepID=A0ABT2D9K9_9BURK|nr:YXWGXW repeat-containing protein [Massilia agilis]MCS0807929.1 YXWGXW repeat-containing protein [Massilia agilis]
MKRSLSLAILLALGTAAYAPLPSMAQTSYSVVIGSAPPAPMYEAIPAPRRGYVWAPGHWEWRGHRHEWVTGYWIAERPGYVYNAPQWYRRDGGWYMEPARWTPYGPDRDRDGIPDRFEARGNGHDRWDRDRWERERWERERWERRHERDRWDRDHDGVPNRYDRAPNDWRYN